MPAFVAAGSGRRCRRNFRPWSSTKTRSSSSDREVLDYVGPQIGQDDADRIYTPMRSVSWESRHRGPQPEVVRRTGGHAGFDGPKREDQAASLRGAPARCAHRRAGAVSPLYSQGLLLYFAIIPVTALLWGRRYRAWFVWVLVLPLVLPTRILQVVAYLILCVVEPAPCNSS